MRFSKSTRYALHAATEMSSAAGRPVTVSEVARRHRIPANALAKAFQRLVRAGLAEGTRGVGGGYRLARSPRTLSVLDVVLALEPARPPGRCVLLDGLGRACSGRAHCRLHGLFAEVDAAVRARFGAVTVADLAPPGGGTPRASGPTGSGRRATRARARRLVP